MADTAKALTHVEKKALETDLINARKLEAASQRIIQSIRDAREGIDTSSDDGKALAVHCDELERRTNTFFSGYIKPKLDGVAKRDKAAKQAERDAVTAKALKDAGLDDDASASDPAKAAG